MQHWSVMNATMVTQTQETSNNHHLKHSTVCIPQTICPTVMMDNLKMSYMLKDVCELKYTLLHFNEALQTLQFYKCSLIDGTLLIEGIVYARAIIFLESPLDCQDSPPLYPIIQWCHSLLTVRQCKRW